jgi:N-acetylmuramic acid 6-phosphate etherase
MTAPPDRSQILTEQRNANSRALHRASVADCVQLIHQEDHGVLAALASGQEALIGFISAVEPGFLAGGRLVYLGAGTSGRLGVLDAAECPPTFGTDPAMVQALIAGGPPALTRAQEGAEDRPAEAVRDVDALAVGDRDFVIGNAASGVRHKAAGHRKERPVKIPWVANAN